MKVCAKILGVVLVGLAIQLTLAAGGKGAGDTLVSRAFTVVSNINSLVSRAFTVSSNTDSLVSRAFTVTTNINSLVSRAFTVSSNTDSLVSRAFTVVVNCDDGLDGLCPDCDNDGMPDGCALDCGPPGGPCFDFPDCGTSDDCDGNGVPDECQLPADTCGDQGGTCTINCDDCNGNCMIDACDIAACSPESPDFPFCNDCNLNGIPDGCDDPDDGIPDECIEWDGGAGDDHFWSAVDNWEGNQVPGSGGAGPEESVVIAGVGAEAILDIDVSIDSLLLGSGATLHIDQLDDMTVESGGAILVEGNLLVAHDRKINALGSSVTIGSGGIYQADPAAKGLVSAELKAGSVIVQGGGVVNLSGSMVLISNGDLLLDESDDDGKGGCKGSGTPPDFNSTDNAEAGVSGSFIISKCARVNVNSSGALLLGGDFDNFSINPDTNTGFNWNAGKLEMNGPLDQTIEAAGDDRGPCWRGFNENFVIGTLTLAENAFVLVIDEFDNQEDGTTACDEVLYVGTLILEAGSELQTNGCRVYYEELINNGGSIPDQETDVLQVESYCADMDGNGEVDPFDLAFLLGSWGPCPPDDDCPADLDGDGNVGAFDLAILLGSWGPV